MRGTVRGRVLKVNADGTPGDPVPDVPVMLMVPRPKGPFVTADMDEKGAFETRITLESAKVRPMLTFGVNGFPPAVQTIDFTNDISQERDLLLHWRQNVVTKASVMAHIEVNGHRGARPTTLVLDMKTWDHSVEVRSMAPIRETFKLGPLENAMEVTLIEGQGQYDDEGHLTFDMKMRITNSLWFVGNADLEMTLTSTGAVKLDGKAFSGSPINRDTQFARLVGSTKVKGSMLDGKVLSALLDVTFEELPLPFLRS